MGEEYDGKISNSWWTSALCSTTVAQVVVTKSKWAQNGNPSSHLSDGLSWAVRKIIYVYLNRSVS